MAPLTKCFVLLTVALFASALATPHISRNVHNHRGLIHPKGAVEARIPIPAALRRKRSLGRRCESQPSNATDPTPSPSPPAPVNVAANPASQSPSPAPQEPAPAPPSSSSTPSSSSPAAPAATSPTSSSGGGSYPSYMTGTQGGQGTYYSTGLGACGITNTDNQRIVAVSHLLYDSYPGYSDVNPNSNPVCGKQITAHYQGKSTTVTVTDRCGGCAITDLDFSPSAFSDLADQSLGRIDVTWTWA